MVNFGEKLVNFEVVLVTKGHFRGGHCLKEKYAKRI
jgi:hypothetical protein